MMRAFATSHRGRPKSVAANDNAPRDLGTAELQMKRAQLARGIDPVLAAHPLDLLLAKAWISETEHRAGWRYAALYRRVVGRTDVSYGRFYDGLAGTGGGPANRVDVTFEEADLAEITQRFYKAKRDLLRVGRAVAQTTERISVFAAWPGWILAPAGGEGDDCKRLQLGLRAIDDSLRGGCR